MSYSTLTTNKARVTFVKQQLATNDAWVLRGLAAIYKYQTEDEKTSEETKHSNGVGFSGADANIMSSFAKQIARRGSLSEKQLVIARRKMQKYARQLVRIASAA